ncbi:SLAC1 family transporter [Saccharolobus solfataricus]|nr:C4-dicarboxylate ABC transporter [Saccharolobus solfataricus]
MSLDDIFGQPISFTMLMGIAGISIASYYDRLTSLSLSSFGISIALLSLLTFFSILNLNRMKYEMVDIMAVISGLTLFIARLRLLYSSLFYFIPLVILSIFYLIIAYRVLRSLKQVSFKYHLLGVAITLLSIELRSYLPILSFIFVCIGIVMYLMVTSLLLKRILKEKNVIKLIDGSIWIQMGLPALISFAISPFSKVVSLVFWYLALIFLPLVILASLIKLISIEISIRQFHPSLWSVIFPQAVLSTATLNIVRVRFIALPILYEISISVLFSALSLFLLFLSIAVFSITS